MALTYVGVIEGLHDPDLTEELKREKRRLGGEKKKIGEVIYVVYCQR